jgi:hypothetical protein
MMIEPSSSLHLLLQNVFQSVFNIYQRWSTRQHHQSPGITLDTTKLDIEPNAENTHLRADGLFTIDSESSHSSS